MEIPIEKINEIADHLEAGFNCFIHRETYEVVAFPEDNLYLDLETDAWKEERNKAKKNKKKFIEIGQMVPSEAFRVMAAFVDALPIDAIKIRLLVALEGKKPFANFKHQIHNSGDYREQWFAFKREKLVAWIQEELRFRF